MSVHSRAEGLLGKPGKCELGSRWRIPYSSDAILDLVRRMSGQPEPQKEEADMVNVMDGCRTIKTAVFLGQSPPIHVQLDLILIPGLCCCK
jgi:hypothetical protein